MDSSDPISILAAVSKYRIQRAEELQWRSEQLLRIYAEADDQLTRDRAVQLVVEATRQIAGTALDLHSFGRIARALLAEAN